jgi:hypothetical protein
MNFDLIRWGWPNAAAIVALAILPVVMLAPSSPPLPQTSNAAIDAPFVQMAMHAVTQIEVE